MEPALLGTAWATFLKTMVHFNSSPEKRVVPSSSKRTNTRMLPESGDMMDLLRTKEWWEKPHEPEHIAVEEEEVVVVVVVACRCLERRLQVGRQ